MRPAEGEASEVRPAEGEATGKRPPENEAHLSMRPNTMIIKKLMEKAFKICIRLGILGIFFL